MHKRFGLDLLGKGEEKRVTILLDASTYKKLKLLQAKKIMQGDQTVNFSQVVREVLKKGLKKWRLKKFSVRIVVRKLFHIIVKSTRVKEAVVPFVMQIFLWNKINQNNYTRNSGVSTMNILKIIWDFSKSYWQHWLV